MVRIRPTHRLQLFLGAQSVPISDVYEYKCIRNALLNAPPDILYGCEFDWPQPKPAEPSILIEKVKERRKARQYKEMVANVTLNQPQVFSELKSGLGIGMTFISILFVGMLSGYYLGKYFFGFGTWGSLVMSFIVTVIGVYVEVILFLMKSEPENKIKTD
jgi:F0F1-type ATP synthase assembly protein I